MNLSFRPLGETKTYLYLRAYTNELKVKGVMPLFIEERRVIYGI